MNYIYLKLLSRRSIQIKRGFDNKDNLDRLEFTNRDFIDSLILLVYSK